jgi:DNA-binding Lrp family transcriptional regulator
MVVWVDELDRRIIEILLENASTPLTAIAKRLKVPEPTVYFRVNRMKRDGIIKKFTIVLGGGEHDSLKAALIYPKRYGLSAMSEEIFDKIGEELARNPDVTFAARVDEAVLAVWRGAAFRPREMEGVKRVEEKGVYAYK